MDVEALILCDAATDNGGKLNILGAFDSIVVKQLPVVHPQCAVALRIRFSRLEEGQHAVKISLMDADGKRVVPDLDAQMNVGFRGPETSVAVNIIMNLQRLKFELAGEYSLDVSIDGAQERSVPLIIRLAPEKPAQA